MWPFSNPRLKPETVVTDTIIQLNGHDDTPPNRAVVIDLTLRFDDVLDAEKLKAALTNLIELGNWRKLGSRVRLDENSGRLEYHVPASFSKERPAFRYTQVHYQTRIDHDPITSRLPKATTRPSVHSDHKMFNSFARHPDTPSKLEDYIYTDAPQMSLHIVSFSDATLISFTWPHWFADAMGVSNLFEAWTLVLNGKEHEVPQLTGFDYDPLASYGSSPAERYVLADFQLKGLNLAIFGVRYIIELFWEKWYMTEEDRTLCIPASTFATIKEATLSDIGSQTPFLSDSDILTAWFTRLVLKEMPWIRNRTIEIMNAFSLRGILSTTLLPHGNSYVSNAVAAVYTFLPRHEILSKPISDTAKALRRAIVEQGTIDQMEAYFHILRGGPFVMGDTSSLLFSYSNWSKARFYKMDFSSAVMKEGISLDRRANSVGRPSYGFSVGHSDSFPRNSVQIFGQDAGGNYWLSGSFRAGVWAKVELALKDI